MMLCVLLASLLICTVRGASTGGCEPVPLVPYAIALSNDTSIGSKVRYNCTEGYVHTGRRTKNTCRRSGWTNNVICSRDVGCDNPNLIAPARNYIDGLPTIRGRKYPEGTKAKVACIPGFEYRGGDGTTTCRLVGTNYRWTSYRRECSPRLCGDAGRPYKGGRDSDVQTMGSQVRFHCNTGYTLVGDSIRTCLADGTWTNHVPRCRLNCCSQLQAPNHGSVRSNGNNCYDDNVTVTCDKGYSITEPAVRSSATITCTADGNWSEHVPVCTETPCAAPEYFPCGHVQVSGYSYADSIQYECHELTTTQGETYGQCKNNGQWTIPPPKCQKHCLEFKREHGTNHYKYDLDHVPHESQIQRKCHPGYILIPPCRDTSLTCNNGTWLGCTASTCEPAPCRYRHGPNQESSARGDDTIMYDQYKPIPSGTAVTIRCKHGYKGAGNALCRNGVLPEVTRCTKMECSLPDSKGTTYTTEVQRRNGYWGEYVTTMDTVTRHVEHGDEIHISCSDGYRSHQTTTRCDAGLFKPPLETCQELFCAQPTLTYAAPISNIKEKYQHGEVISIKCVESYRNQTNYNRYTCRNEKWTPQAPVDCTDQCIIPNLENTIFSPEGRTVDRGTNVTVSCDPSYKPVHPSSVCQKGFLDPKPEKCISMHCRKPNNIGGDTILVPSKYNYIHNEQVNIHCNPGFALPKNAPKIVTCIDTHLAITPCEPVFCSRPQISNASFTDTLQYHHDQTVEVTCKRGYRLEGDQSTTCQDGVWTNLKMNCTDDCLIPSYYRTSFLRDETILEPGKTVATGTNLIISCPSNLQTTTPNSTCTGGRLIPEPTGCVAAFTTPTPSSTEDDNIGQQSPTPTPPADEVDVRVDVNPDTPDNVEEKQPDAVVFNGTEGKLPESCQRMDTDELKFEYIGTARHGAREKFTCQNTIYAIGEDPPHNQHNYVTCQNGSFVPTPECKDTMLPTTPTTGTTTEERNQEPTPTVKVTPRSSSCDRVDTDDYTFDYHGLIANDRQEGYSCTITGYTAVGEEDENGQHNYVRCRDGQFEPRPECKAPLCQVPASTTYMWFSSRESVNPGGQVEYQCLQSGKARDGTAHGTSTCLGGQLDPTPLCNRPGCDRGMALYKPAKCVGDAIDGGTSNIPQDECLEQCFQSHECTALVYHNNTTCTLYSFCSRSRASNNRFKIYKQIPRCL